MFPLLYTCMCSRAEFVGGGSRCHWAWHPVNKFSPTPEPTTTFLRHQFSKSVGFLSQATHAHLTVLQTASSHQIFRNPLQETARTTTPTPLTLYCRRVLLSGLSCIASEPLCDDMLDAISLNPRSRPGHNRSGSSGPCEDLAVMTLILGEL